MTVAQELHLGDSSIYGSLPAEMEPHDDDEDFVARSKKSVSTCWLRTMNKTSTCGLVNNILFPWLVISVFFGIGLSISNFLGDQQGQSPGFVTLPDFLVPVVWYTIAALTGIARFHLVRDMHHSIEGSVVNPPHPDPRSKASHLITGYQVAIGAYAVYALPISGYAGLVVGLVGNVFTGAYCLWIVILLWKVSRLDSFLMLPSIPWLCFASALVISSMIDMQDT